MTVMVVAVAAKVTSSPSAAPDLVAVALTATMTEAHQAEEEEGAEGELTVATSNLLEVSDLALLPLMDLQQNVSHRCCALPVGRAAMRSHDILAASLLVSCSPFPVTFCWRCCVCLALIQQSGKYETPQIVVPLQTTAHSLDKTVTRQHVNQATATSSPFLTGWMDVCHFSHALYSCSTDDSQKCCVASMMSSSQCTTSAQYSLLAVKPVQLAHEACCSTCAGINYSQFQQCQHSIFGYAHCQFCWRYSYRFRIESNVRTTL